MIPRMGVLSTLELRTLVGLSIAIGLIQIVTNDVEIAVQFFLLLGCFVHIERCALDDLADDLHIFAVVVGIGWHKRQHILCAKLYIAWYDTSIVDVCLCSFKP